MALSAIPAVPGLFFDRDYFSPAACSSLVSESLSLCERLEAATPSPDELQKASIPQPEYVRSQKHNLASEELYTRVVLDEPDGGRLRCEFFPKYGEAGHSLAYFRGNQNLPLFARGELLERVRRSVREIGLLSDDGSLTWKLTMNFYRNSGGTVAGFPFHVDIPANGVVTMILNVQREATFQIAKDDDVHDVAMSIGSLLVLSGESRYVWKHRVLPSKAAQSTPLGAVERVSLVLGYQ